MNSLTWADLFSEPGRRMKANTIREFLKFASQPEMISFAGGLPAADLFPSVDWPAALQSIFRQTGSACLQYGESEGVYGLREWIARRASAHGMPVRPDNVVITTGSQQALDLTGKVLLNSGDIAAVENPTYLALLSSWRPIGTEFEGIPSDKDGMIVDDLAKLDPSPKVVYVTPNFQNPQGTTLSRQRRVQLIDVAREKGIVVIEDDPYGELRYSGEPLPSLLELDCQSSGQPELKGHTIQIGTFSKILAPGFRVGWVLGPAEFIQKLVQAKQSSDLHTSTLAQYLVLELVRSNLLASHIPLLCKAYAKRRDAMLVAMNRHFPKYVRWSVPEGGFLLLVHLPESCRARDLLPAALASNVIFVPGDDFYLDGQGQNTLRLNFSNATPQRIEIGIERLGRILSAQ